MANTCRQTAHKKYVFPPNCKNLHHIASTVALYDIEAAFLIILSFDIKKWAVTKYYSIGILYIVAIEGRDG